MNDAKTMGSLEEKLMSYVSTTPQQDANYDIALAMLTHYGKLKNLSLAEIADLCYVSKASISRFCRFMGFDGFRELHDCLLQDFSIRTDFRKIIGILIALGNPNFSNEAKAIIAVQIMYEKWWEIPEENLNEALQKAYEFIDCGR